MVKARKIIRTYKLKPGAKEEVIAAQDPRVIRIYQVGGDFYADVCETCACCKVESRCP